MRRLVMVLTMAVLIGSGAHAEPSAVSQAGLDEAVELGGVATLAQLCGLRDEAWAFDLRRAMILQTTRTTNPDDLALYDAPGSALVVGALSFADVEALESFAEGLPEHSCGPLTTKPALDRADRAVEVFRMLRSGKRPAS